MTKKIIHLDTEVKESIKTHSQLTYPFACCGFIFGEDNYGRFVTHSLPVQNLQDNGRDQGYKISAIDYMNAERFAQEENINLLGIYHSHLGQKTSTNNNELLHLHPSFSLISFELKDGQLHDIKALRLNNEALKMEEDKILVTSSILN